MTDTDTRAALDAATLALIEAATEEGKAWGLHSLPSGDDSTYADYSRANEARGNAEDDIKAAITAHVEAEVTRRLACAPSVETALAAYGTAVYELGYVLHRPDRDAVLRPVKDTAEAALRAAIAADRERAVEFAVDQAAKPMARRMAAEIVTTDAMISYVVGGLRVVGLLRVGPGDLDAVTWTRLAKAIDEVRRVPADLTRPTPDEARRLVEEYGNAVVACIPAIEAGARGDGDAVNAMADVIDRGNKTLAALLRALGVEA